MIGPNGRVASPLTHAVSSQVAQSPDQSAATPTNGAQRDHGSRQPIWPVPVVAPEEVYMSALRVFASRAFRSLADSLDDPNSRVQPTVAELAFFRETLDPEAEEEWSHIQRRLDALTTGMSGEWPPHWRGPRP